MRKPLSMTFADAADYLRAFILTMTRDTETVRGDALDALARMRSEKPVYGGPSCPCCASTQFYLEHANRFEAHRVMLDGARRPVYCGPPLTWACAHCGFAMLGHAIPVRIEQVADDEHFAPRVIAASKWPYDGFDIKCATEVRP